MNIINFNENTTRLALKISLWLKGFFALIEILGGVIFYFVSQVQIINFIDIITRDELSEDPRDFISNYLVTTSHNLFLSTQHFIAIYLLFHGTVKMIAIVGLLKDKLWAYPFSFAVFSVFIFYQLYRFSFTHSIWLLVITLFDLIIISLIWREYIFIKNQTQSLTK